MPEITFHELKMWLARYGFMTASVNEQAAIKELLWEINNRIASFDNQLTTKPQ